MTVTDAAPLGGAGPIEPTTVQLSGELDLLTCPAVRDELLHVLRSSNRMLVIDLSGVTFCDASGLSLLIDVQRRARRRGVVLALAHPCPCVARVLHISGLDRSFPFVA